MSRITLIETTASGSLLNTYIVTPLDGPSHEKNSGQQSLSPRSSPEGRINARIDVIPPETTISPSSLKSTSPPSSRLSLSSLRDTLLAPFLPVGYPDSVSPDYTSYQLYDSLQAALSTIASLLASRAVLTTLGVGSADATTSLAINLSILQTTISNISSILFAHRFSTSIAQEVKFYRFFADIVNDAAFVLDVLSPSLPTYARVPTLCVASACRSICGVAGGASKAVLSSHFATRGNIGEVNAKDGSQETVVNLVGMWIGGLVVGSIEGTLATWSWLLVLLAGHLWANWMAVRSVRLRTLNPGRASMVIERVLEGRDCGVDVVGSEERMFGRRDQIRSRGRVAGEWAFCGVDGLLSSIQWSRQGVGRAYSGDIETLQALLEIFQREDYLLWWDRGRRLCVIVLKATSNGNVGCDIHLKAMCHAWLIASRVESPSSEKASSEVEILRQSLPSHETTWRDCLVRIKQGGWDLDGSSLATEATSRLRAQME